MTQRAFLQELDAQIMGAFVDAGMADSGTYTPPGGGAGGACDVLIDRDVKLYGDDQAQVATSHLVVTLFLATVAAPERGGTITVGSETFKLDAKLDEDESQSRWVVLT